MSAPEPAPRPPDRDPQAYPQLLASGALLQAGKTVVSPHVMLPWIMALLGGTPVLVALVLPLWRLARVGGRVLLSGWIDSRAVLRPAILGTLGARLAFLLLLALLLDLESPAATVIVLLAAMVFGLADGIGTLSGRRQLGKLVPRHRLGRLLASQTGLSRALVILVLGGQLWLGDTGNGGALGDGAPGAHIAVAGVAVALAFGVMILVREPPGPPPTRRSSGLGTTLGLLRSDRMVRRLALADLLGLGLNMTAPFFVLLTTREAMPGDAVVIFILAQMLGALAGGGLFARVVDRRPRLVVLSGSGVLMLATLAAMLVEEGAHPGSIALHAPLFLAAGVTQSGYRAVQNRTVLTSVESGAVASALAAINLVSSGAAMAIGLGLGLLAHGLFVEAALATLLVLQAAAALYWTRTVLATQEP